MESYTLDEKPEFAQCADCGGQLLLKVWGEGIDSHIKCTECDNKVIYR